MPLSEFVPSAPILLQFAVACVVLAITPGPDKALYVGRAVTRSRAAGLACLAGTVTGTLIHTMLVALGLSALLVAAPTAFLALKIVGAGYLVFLAWQAIRHGSSLTIKGERKPVGPLWGHYLSGIGINILNPKVALFFMTFLPQFVRADDPQAPGKLVFLGLFFIVVALPITLPMVLAANAFSQALMQRPRLTRTLDWLLAGVFGAFAVKILMAEGKG